MICALPILLPPEDSSKRAKCLYLLLLPFVRFCIRHNIAFQEFTQTAKYAFVKSAESYLSEHGQKANASRVSAVTGLTRTDAARLAIISLESNKTSINLLGRVLGAWEQNRQYKNKAGHPRPIRFRGNPNEFRDLVEQVSKHLSPRSVQLELERLGMVKRDGDFLIRLAQAATGSHDSERTFEILSDDIHTLILSIEENTLNIAPISNLHLRTFFDNIFIIDLPHIRKWLIDEGKLFHRKVRDYLSAYDKDIAIDRDLSEEAGGYVSITAFSVTSPISQECSVPASGPGVSQTKQSK